MRVLAFGCMYVWWGWERRQTRHGEQNLSAALKRFKWLSTGPSVAARKMAVRLE
jgi:hypothetical protein